MLGLEIAIFNESHEKNRREFFLCTLLNLLLPHKNCFYHAHILRIFKMLYEAVNSILKA